MQYGRFVNTRFELNAIWNICKHYVWIKCNCAYMMNVDGCSRGLFYTKQSNSKKLHNSFGNLANLQCWWEREFLLEPNLVKNYGNVNLLGQYWITGTSLKASRLHKFVSWQHGHSLVSWKLVLRIDPYPYSLLNCSFLLLNQQTHHHDLEFSWKIATIFSHKLRLTFLSKQQILWDVFINILSFTRWRESMDTWAQGLFSLKCIIIICWPLQEVQK